MKLISAALVVCLICTPSIAGYYPNCGYTTYSYYPHYYTPAAYVAPQTTCYDTPHGTVCNNTYNTPTQYVDTQTFYQVGSQTTAARLAQEASEQTLAKFKVELAKAEADRQAALEKQQDREFKQQMLLAIQQLSQRQAAPAPAPAPAPDPEKVRLRAENEQMKATLMEIVARQKSQTAAPTPAKQVMAGSPVQGVFNSKCTKCHGNGEKQGGLDLTNADAVPLQKIAKCIELMSSPDAATRMPKNGDPVTPEEFFTVERYLLARVQSERK